MPDESYADVPVSIAETRAEKEHNGDIWTARDLLIQTLRRIDSGELDPEAMMVIYRSRDPDGVLMTVGYRISTHGMGSQDEIRFHALVGMLEEVKFDILYKQHKAELGD